MVFRKLFKTYPVEVHDVNLGDINKRMLQKVEELTLYAIEQDKKLNTKNEGAEKCEEARLIEQRARSKMEEKVSSMESELQAINVYKQPLS